jgi:3-deoxy-D-manno-octulosonic-acid transferase
MYVLYTLILAVLLGLYAPIALTRGLTRGVPLNLRDRLGQGRARRRAAGRAAGWIHAVSVGEAIAAAPLVEGLRRRHPDLPLVFTTVTETGARVARERYGHLATHRYFPLDLPGAARRVIGAIDPAFLICMETELWPNVLRELAARRVPVMVANGRLSDRSFRRYRRARPLVRRMLGHVTVFAMQTAEDARRVIALGADPERVVVTGNLKADAPPDGAGVTERWRGLFDLGSDETLWIAGSTHRGEDETVLEAHARLREEMPGLVLVIAPRHPERVPEVIRLIEARGWPAVRRSRLPCPREGGAVIVLDTIGELAQCYSVAAAVFVGGSLVPAGGQNMLEPALRRKPVLFGPHTDNFREPAARLLEVDGAIRVRDVRELTAALRHLFTDPGLREAMGEAAFLSVSARTGAVGETLDLVSRFLCAGVRSGAGLATGDAGPVADDAGVRPGG